MNFARIRAAFAVLLFMFAIPGHAATSERTHSINGVEYAKVGDIALRMDVCLPVSAVRTPAIIIVHGGGWVAGDRRYNVEPLFRPLSDAGFAWFSISYRLAPDVTQFGVAIEDVRSAVRFVRSHATEYNVDPGRIALVGESAGGQLAAMAALKADPATRVKAVVALYTPTDLVTLAESSNYIPRSVRESVRGTPWETLVLAGLAQLSPINNVHAGMPPFLFIHGTQDSVVPFSQSVEMCSRIKQAGGSCEVYGVQGGGHGIRWWESYPKLAAQYKAKMIEWLEQQLNSTPAFRS
jgi:acetyl esterase